MIAGQHDPEYRGLMASAWDLLRGDTTEWPDRALYRRLILEDGQPALDVGCGTGRLLLEFLSEGLDVEGLDVAPEMLELCRTKAAAAGLEPVLHLQGIEELDLERRYRTILVPSSSFQLVTDPAAAREALRRMHEHLLPGGRLAMSFMVFWREGRPQERDWHLAGEATRPEDGLRVRRWCRWIMDAESRLQDTWDRYEVLEGETVVQSEEHERQPAARWYSLDEALELYREAGFEGAHALRGFTDDPADEGDDLFTAIGTRS